MATEPTVEAREFADIHMDDWIFIDEDSEPTIKEVALWLDEFSRAAVEAETERCAGVYPANFICVDCNAPVGSLCRIAEGPTGLYHGARWQAAIRAGAEGEKDG
jgi:hypothetical protein